MRSRGGVYKLWLCLSESRSRLSRRHFTTVLFCVRGVDVLEVVFHLRRISDLELCPRRAVLHCIAVDRLRELVHRSAVNSAEVKCYAVAYHVVQLCGLAVLGKADLHGYFKHDRRGDLVCLVSPALKHCGCKVRAVGVAHYRIKRKGVTHAGIVVLLGRIPLGSGHDTVLEVNVSEVPHGAHGAVAIEGGISGDKYIGFALPVAVIIVVADLFKLFKQVLRLFAEIGIGNDQSTVCVLIGGAESRAVEEGVKSEAGEDKTELVAVRLFSVGVKVAVKPWHIVSMVSTVHSLEFTRS